VNRSARAAGVPQPVLPEDDEKQLDALTKWWKQHDEKMVPQDPWLKLLEKQKVD
jgi:hypothetical protein